MLQTIFVYTITAFLMVALCRHGVKYKSNVAFILAILVYGIVFGMRWRVGTDFMAYYNSYHYAQIRDNLATHVDEHWESGFKWYLLNLARQGVESWIYFGIIAIMPVIGFFYAMKDRKYLYPYIAFALMFGCGWLQLSNILRQVMAIGIIAMALPFLVNRRFILFGASILLASLFHNSALVLLVLIPAYYYKQSYFHNIKIQYAILLFSILFMKMNFVTGYFDRILPAIELLGYDGYSDSRYADVRTLTLRAGFYLNLLKEVVIIYYSNDTKKCINSRMYTLIYDFYFFGIAASHAFSQVMLLGRLSYYFSVFSPIVGGAMIYYLQHDPKRKYAFLFVIGLYFISLWAVLYRMDENYSRYLFYWQA
jgi:hypothetical protein